MDTIAIAPTPTPRAHALPEPERVGGAGACSLVASRRGAAERAPRAARAPATGSAAFFPLCAGRWEPMLMSGNVLPTASLSGASLHWLAPGATT
eukprot:scaffold12362_cov124-Isochrysis_galbana.AAC.5